MAAAEVDRVHALTGGNPFFVGEVGRVLADRQAGGSIAAVTASVREAIGARLTRLSPECVRLLRAASIVGPEFSVAVVAVMVRTPVLGCLGLLDEALAAGLVVAVSTPGQHRFVHALARDAIEAGLGTPDRVRLHRMAAEAIEEFYTGRLDPHLSDLARHWAVAAVEGDRARAVGWITRAAREAMRRLAYEEGARLFGLALAVGAGQLDQVDRCRARQLVCPGPDGLQERERLAELMPATGRTSGNPATQMWAHLWRIDASFQRGDLARVARELEELAWCTEEVRGPVARWQLLRCRAALAQAQARFDDARRLAEQAYTQLSASGHPAVSIVRAGLLTSMGNQLGHGADESGSLVANGLADATAGEQEFPTAGVIMSIAPAFLLAADGRLAAAAAIYRRLGPPAGWRPMPHVVTVCYAFGISVAIALNASDDVATLRDLPAHYRGHHVASGGGAVAYNGPVELHLGMAVGHLGLLDDAVAQFDHAARVCAANGAAGFGAEAQYERGVVLARRARPRDLLRARSLVADCARQAADLGMAPFVARAGRLMAQLDGGPCPHR